MKKLLLLLVCSLIISKSKAQVVFCPPGAEWHYLFNGSIFYPGNTYNEEIKYTGDSISGTDTIKILSHHVGTMDCGNSVLRTLIHQKGDTIFFSNKLTDDTWQILYNFATPAGQTWQTNVRRYNYPMPVAKIYTVQAVNTVTINGHALRKLNIASPGYGATEVTERLGSNYFLFNIAFSHPASCDGGAFMEFLCYQDNSFGIKQIGQKSCDYYTSNEVGIRNEALDNIIKIYPNPFTEFINVDFENSSDHQIVLLDLSGRCILTHDTKLTGSSLKLETADLHNGIYFLQIFEKDKLLKTEKIIKQ